MTRILHPKTLNLKGIIRGRNVNILVDSRSIHNCLNIDLTKQLNLCVCPIKDLTMIVALGKRFKEIGECQKVSI